MLILNVIFGETMIRYTPVVRQIWYVTKWSPKFYVVSSSSIEKSECEYNWRKSKRPMQISMRLVTKDNKCYRL